MPPSESNETSQAPLAEAGSENQPLEEQKKPVPNNLMPKGEVLCFGGVSQKSGGLQKHFDRFRRAKKEEIQYRNYMAA